MDRGGFDRKWRFHDEMQAPIRPHEQREILTIPPESRYIQDSPGDFKQVVHLKNLSAVPPV